VIVAAWEGYARRVEWALASIAVALLCYAALAGRLEGTPLTAAMVFTGVGLLIGSEALGFVDLAPHGDVVQTLAEATLALVLFADASRIDLRTLRGEATIPTRLLAIGLPLTIVAGLVAALPLFGGLGWAEALLLAVILAPTDAALGQAVVTLPALPSRVRQSLNVESGLNDGICVPLFLVVLAIASVESDALGGREAIRLVAEQIGYGALAGAIAGAAGAAAILLAARTGRADDAWLEIVPFASAALAWGIAHPLGGSGFIAAFVGGVAFQAVRRDSEGEVGHLIDEAGDVLGAVTFVVFGAVLLGPALQDASWAVAAYAALSLTVVRMAPVAMSLLGTGMRRESVGFLGWFGPRGLASIVFALMLAEDGGVTHADTIMTATFVTVGLSVLLHGLSAAPLAARYARWFAAAHRPGREPDVESTPAPEIRWRHPLGARRG
jgi:NhaP-type Na+/H+ or K+/H+ antiporter